MSSPISRLTIPHLLRSPLVTVVIACILLVSARMGGLNALPLHNDEGLHLTRAVEVWNGHPFWEIGDGKIINHWAIALFYPQNAPDFVGRLPTVLIALIGLSAGIWIGRKLGGAPGGWLVAALWVANPYLHFYERLAFSDAEAGALIVLAVAAALRWRMNAASPLYSASSRHTRSRRRAAFVGFALALAALFKFTALPYALSILLLILAPASSRASSRTFPVRQRVSALIVIAGVSALMFAPPLLYLLLRGDLFSIARGWVGGDESGGLVLGDNIARLLTLIGGFGSPAWAVLAGVGLLIVLTRPAERWLPLAWLAPTLILLAVGRDAQPRHFAVFLPFMVTVGGAGLGMLLKPLRGTAAVNPRAASPRSPRQLVSDGGLLTLGLGMALVVVFRPYAETLMTDPPAAALPAWVRAEHIAEHSSGYGLQEAMLDLPVRVHYLTTRNLMQMTATEARVVLNRRDPLVLAAFFPDSCKRANFYATRIALTCIGAQPDAVRAALSAVLERDGFAYVLADSAPILSPDLPALAAALGAQAERAAAYRRPGESLGGESVVLWWVGAG